jgi:hypothetical protein
MESDRVTCPHCGAFNDVTARQCLICGTPLNPYAAPPPAPQPLAPQPAVPVPPAPARAAPARRSAVSGVAVALGLVGLCVGLLLGLGAMALAGPGIALPFLTPPTPTPVDPAAVLTQANAAMAGVTSYRYVMTATFQGLPSGDAPSQTMSVRLAGDVLLPDRYTLRTSEFGDLIVVGDDAYLRNEAAPGWRKRLARDASPGLAPTNPLRLPRFLQYPRDPFIGAEVISGTERLHTVNLGVERQPRDL